MAANPTILAKAAISSLLKTLSHKTKIDLWHNSLLNAVVQRMILESDIFDAFRGVVKLMAI